jgi:hypothetical protein
VLQSAPRLEHIDDLLQPHLIFSNNNGHKRQSCRQRRCYEGQREGQNRRGRKGWEGQGSAADQCSPYSGLFHCACIELDRHLTTTQCEKHGRKEEALAKLKAGAKFDEVAREFSEDKARAGMICLGWMDAT